MTLAAKLVLTPLLAAQAVVTRVRMPRLPEAAGPRQGRVGQGPVLRLLITGDSSAAGVGVVHQRLALAGQLPGLLSRRGGLQVQWHLLARSGLSSAQTLALLQSSEVPHADIVLAVTGVNDVVEQVPSHRAVAARAALADHCRNALGALHVVFAPLPPVHQMHGLPQPLRWVAGHDARRHDRALAHWAATRADVSYVPVPLQLNRGVLASDGFHPGEPVYRQCALAMAEYMLRLPALQALQPPSAKPAADTPA
jgi:lysophospholipase L1-like esterase